MLLYIEDAFIHTDLNHQHVKINALLLINLFLPLYHDDI